MNKTISRCFAILTMILPFCQAQTSEEHKALISFKALVRRHVTSYEGGGREHITKLGGGWAKEIFTLDPASAKFDVQKTSSLVSPFVGVLTFTLVRNLTAFHSVEADAATDPIFVQRDSTIHRHVFAFQDEAWRPTNRKYSHIGKSSGGEFPCDEFLNSREKSSEKDIHGCLEEFDGDRGSKKKNQAAVCQRSSLVVVGE